MEKYALVNIHDHNFNQLCDMTWTNNRKLYAEKHSYETFSLTEGFSSDISLGWQRLLFIENVMLSRSDIAWIWLTGSDTMVTNFNIKIEDRIDNNYHYMMSVDFNSVNADSVLFRNSVEGRKLIREIIDLEPKYRNDPWHEQGAMADMFGLPRDLSPWPEHISEAYKNIVKIMPQKYMNSYEYSGYHPGYPHSRNNLDRMGQYGNWESGDWLIHWPGTTLEHRMNAAARYSKEVLM